MKKPPLPEELQKLHNEAVARGLFWYRDPETKYLVFTELYHKKRGKCCGARCRHCAYEWENVGFTPNSTLGLIIICFIVASTLFITSATAQRVCIDTVLVFQKGSGQQVGQGPAFFPKNIFGVPDINANDTVPSIDPRQICSLGLNGSITVGNSQHVIINKPGADFIIYENAFRYTSDRIYIEPAKVEVSKNAIDWIQFPYDTVTFIGCAGITPTTGNDPFDERGSGGDVFDLETLGIDSVRWIRLTDVTQSILDRPTSPFYDPTKTGFDLDAVCYVHAERVAFTEKIEEFPNTRLLTIQCTEPAMFYVYDVYGRLYQQEYFEPGVHTISNSGWLTGAYFTVLQTARTVLSNRLLR